MDLQKLKAAGIDCDGALQRFMGSEELYARFLGRFLEDTHVQGAVLAMEKRDYKELQQQVHALKGFTGTLGLDTIYQQACEIVIRLRNDETDGIEQYVTELDEEKEKLFTVITEVLSEL